MAPDHAAQDGGLSQRTAKEKFKEAAQKLFAKPEARDSSAMPGDMPDDHSGSQSDANDTVPLEDPAVPLLPWDTVSSFPVIPTQQTAITPDPDGPEPTLCDIFSAVTSCNSSIAALASEVKGVRIEITFLRQGMQKLRDRS